MRIVLTNDDGIHARGLLALHQALSGTHEVLIVAPEAEQSAVGHSITLADPIRVKEIFKNGTFFGFALTGTPADCVRLAAGELMNPPPDIVISGINLGANVGINILYSGTVSAATEAAIMGLPSMAVSLDTFSKPDFGPAAGFACRLAEKWPRLEIPAGVSLNVNVPALPKEKIKGALWTPQSLAVPGEEFTRRIDPRDNVYYWRGKEIQPEELDPQSDHALLTKQYITITPIKHDMTHHEELARLRKHKIQI